MTSSGSLHHLEVWVDDLDEAERSWGWLLTRLGYTFDERWEHGHVWRLADAYVVLEASPARVVGRHERLRAGMNHVAFWAGSPAQVEAIVADAAAHGWSLMFADSRSSWSLALVDTLPRESVGRRPRLALGPAGLRSPSTQTDTGRGRRPDSPATTDEPSRSAQPRHRGLKGQLGVTNDAAVPREPLPYQATRPIPGGKRCPRHCAHHLIRYAAGSRR